MAKRSFDKPMAALAAKWGWVLSKAEGRRGPISHDLFGFIDFVVISDAAIIGVQVTDRSNMANRCRKIEEKAELAGRWLSAGGLLYVIGFGRVGVPQEEGTARVVEFVFEPSCIGDSSLPSAGLMQMDPVIWTYEDL